MLQRVRNVPESKFNLANMDFCSQKNILTCLLDILTRFEVFQNQDVGKKDAMLLSPEMQNIDALDKIFLQFFVSIRHIIAKMIDNKWLCSFLTRKG